MSETNENAQAEVCRFYERSFVPCRPDSKLGVAIQTIGQAPLNGLRHPPTSETNGWFIWAGEYSESADFFVLLHTAHLSEQLPQVIKFLGLPPGSRFLLADEFADVWFDDSLLNV
jgi:hypothetical protein